MLIHCNTTFLDGRDRFEKGETRVVDDDRAARFIAAGWASESDKQPVPAASGAADLDVHNTVMGQEARHG